MLNFDFIKIQFNNSVYELRGKTKSKLINSINIHEWLSGNYSDRKLNLEDIKVYSIHLTEDIFIGETEHYLSQIARLPFRNLKVETYKNNEKGQLTGIVISTKKTKKGSRSTYLTIYDKFVESGRNEQYRGILRIEQKISTFKGIKSKLEIRDNNLDQVLNSKANPAKKLIQSIYNQIELLTTTKMNKTLLTNLENQVYDSFFREHNYEWYEINNNLKLSEITPFKIRKVKSIYTNLVRAKNSLNYDELFKPLLTEQKKENTI